MALSRLSTGRRTWWNYSLESKQTHLHFLWDQYWTWSIKGKKGKIWSISSAPPNHQNAQHYKLQVRLTRQGGVGVERLSSGCQRLCLWRINKVTINVISIVNIVIITTILFNLSRSPRSDQTKTCPGLTWLRSSARWGKPWRQCVLALASPTSPLRRPVSTGDNALDNICWKNLEKSFMHSRRLFYLLSLQRCDWCSVERSCQPWKTDAAWKVWGGHSNFNPSILTEVIHWCQILGWESLIGFGGRFLGRCVSPARSGGQRAALSPLPWSSRDDHCRSTMVMMVMTIMSPQPWS